MTPDQIASVQAAMRLACEPGTVMPPTGLADALCGLGWTPPPPKTVPPPLVTMEESRERYFAVCQLRGASLSDIARWWDAAGQSEDENTADDWLVKTVNRRIIEGLGAKNFSVTVDFLYRHFCGEPRP